METIPIVDFSRCCIEKNKVTEKDYEAVGEDIKKAFSTWGFVYLTNTGIYR